MKEEANGSPPRAKGWQGEEMKQTGFYQLPLTNMFSLIRKYIAVMKK